MDSWRPFAVTGGSPLRELTPQTMNPAWCRLWMMSYMVESCHLSDLASFLFFGSGGGDAVSVQALAYVGMSPTGYGFVEDAPHDGGCVGVFDEDVVEGVAVFLPDLLELVAVGSLVAGIVAALSDLALPTANFLREVRGIKGVYFLDHTFHELAGRAVVGRFLDGNDADSSFLEPVLVDCVVHAVPREAGELPYQDDLEGFVLAGRLGHHLLELRTVVRAAAFGLVDECDHDGHVVVPGELFALGDLSFDGVVDVLGVAGDSGVYGH